MNPPILPWYLKAAEAILSEPLPTMSQFVSIENCTTARINETAKRIAAHDPHAAQHAETVRLLEEATHEIHTSLDNNHPEADAHTLLMVYRKLQSHAVTLKGSLK